MNKGFLFLFSIFFIGSSVFSQTTQIHVDQFGYQKAAQKIAVLANPQIGFNANESYTPSSTIEVIRSSDSQTVFSGTPMVYDGGNTDIVSGDAGWWFDFTSLTDTGTFYVFDAGNNMSSPEFTISEEPYREVLRAASKMFYYNRCNHTKATPFTSAEWGDGMNFSNPLQDANCRDINDPSNVSLEKDLSGGWFDDGGTSKSVKDAFFSVHALLTAYQKNPSLFTDNWNLPESGNGVPDLLDELKWELDWVLKMTNPDGTVHTKVGNQNYAQNVSSPPSANVDPRFYGPICSSATLAAASVLAHGASVFKNIPGMNNYALQLQTEALACYNYGFTFYQNSSFETNCDTSSIADGNTDWSIQGQFQALLSASIYLYDVTGDPVYQTFIINNGYLVSPLSNNSWSQYELPIADAWIYYTTISGANTGMQAAVLSSANSAIANNWSGSYGIASNGGLYRDFMPAWAYYSGSNYGKAGLGCLNIAMSDFGAGNTMTAQNRGQALLHYFHGVNPFGTVYLTNMSSYGAEKSINQIYHAWFADGTDFDDASTSLYGPPPGIVTGGPNKYVSVPTLTPPYGQPDSKSFLDHNGGWPDNGWETSQPEIDIQAFYIRLLADVIGSEQATLALDETIDIASEIYPNPTSDKLWVAFEREIDRVQIFNLLGKKVFDSDKVTKEIDVSRFEKGTYILLLESQEQQMRHKFVKN